MSDVVLRVLHAGPFVTVQDEGRIAQARRGIPKSGPMDRFSHGAANVAVGNPSGATAIEISPGGLIVECTVGSVSVAVAGGGFVVEHQSRHFDAAAAEGWVVRTLEAGDRFTVRSGSWGSWATMAMAGELVAPRWLGSTATHSTSGFGGGAVTPGHDLVVRHARSTPDRDGPIPTPSAGTVVREVRVVLGPQERHFADGSIERLLGSSYRLSDAYDRMGVRLEGPPLELGDALSIPSEPVARGSIQVAGDGVPTVLLADHQTTGGYPKIATVVSADLDGLAQCRSGDEIRFTAISAAEAVTAARTRAHETDLELEAISRPGRTLEQRLRLHDLNSWGNVD